MENISPEIQNYINILEKTNQQLSLWYNPYGVIVGVLAILFTILTIVAVVIIYRQSRDYKEKINADRELYKKTISDFLVSQMKIIKQKNKTAKDLSRKIDDILDEYKKKLERSSKEQKEEIQKAIDKLELEKLSLKTDIGPITVTPDFDYSSISGINFSKKFHKCSKCGFGFYINTNNTNLFYMQPGTTVTCPKCQNVDTIY